MANGYSWLLDNKEPDGVLVEDRYSDYNKSHCWIQYCYAYLLRDVEDLRDEFANAIEVQSFTTTVIPVL